MRGPTLVWPEPAGQVCGVAVRVEQFVNQAEQICRRAARRLRRGKGMETESAGCWVVGGDAHLTPCLAAGSAAVSMGVYRR